MNSGSAPTVRRDLCQIQAYPKSYAVQRRFVISVPRVPSSISGPSMVLTLPWGTDLSPCADFTWQPAHLSPQQKVQGKAAGSMSYWTSPYTDMSSARGTGR